MCWNDLKFQVLRLGSKSDIIENTTLFSPDFGEVVEAKLTIKDLGILADDEVNYEDQLFKAVSKSKQKAAWVLKTFSSCYIDLLRTMWRILIKWEHSMGSL